MKANGVHLLVNYPKCSQDLNPIETAWREIRARLALTEPSHVESRSSFVARLRSAVTWVNKHRASYLQQLCVSQKTRATDILSAQPPGSRTKH